ncbi:MAG: T9SS type A sorting domain-containing protein [Bacteroidia bacterium]|nr:T9SS type A sorting domain-containing protein [Bacteroidia bacterium]
MKFAIACWVFVATVRTASAQFYTLSLDFPPYRELENATPLRDPNGRLTAQTQTPIYDFFFPLFGDTMTLMTLTPHYVRFERQGEMGAVALAMDVQILDDTEISYLKQGPQGGQTITLQWKNAGFGNDFVKTDRFDAQLTLHEQNGCIEMQFGACNFSYPERYVGLNLYRHPEYEETPTHAAGLAGIPEAAYLSEGGHLWGAPPTGVRYQICPAPAHRLPSAPPNDEGLVVHPNPVFDVLRIKGPSNASVFRLYDASGRVLETSSRREFDFFHRPRGIYLLVAQDLRLGRVSVCKIVKP